jgi:hypothetical protein
MAELFVVCMFVVMYFGAGASSAVAAGWSKT